MKLLILFEIITRILSANVLTYYNGNYTVTPNDYNNKSRVKVQLWGDNALRYGLFNTYGSSGGFIEADIETFGNTTFKVQTGNPTLELRNYYLLYDGRPSVLSYKNNSLKAGGGRWLQTVCEAYRICFVAFGGTNVVSVNNNTNVTMNYNGTGELALNNGLVRFYY
jgi:hypothetical protein